MNNSPFHRATDQSPLSRRDFLWQSGGGLGGLALTAMLGREPLLAKGVLSGTLHHPPKAKRVIQLFMGGAASHLDTFDFKPALIRHHGEKSDFGEHVEAFQNGLGPWMQSPFAFARHGQSGKHLSEAVAPLGEVVDDLAFVHNLVGKTGVHSQATYLQATGFQRPGFPGMGSWVSYALGSENENLPTFVVLPDHRGYASNGPKNWASAFLPTHTQGTTIFPQRENPIPDLHPKAGFVTPASHRAGIDLINQLNADYAETRPGDDRLEARIWSGNDNSRPRRNWDSHEDIERDHGSLALGMARGAAGLIRDLKQRGLLEDTIIHWTTEFGRMPSTQGSKGRDHNPYVFTNWLCGGGIRGGVTAGQSDEWGYKPLDRANPTQVYDIHATMLHLLGIDHKQLTIRHNGIDRRLTDVHGHVVNDLLA